MTLFTYSTPKELFEIEIVKTRFKSPQEIGYFMINISDIVSSYRTKRSLKIHTESFVNLLQIIETYKNELKHGKKE